MKIYKYLLIALGLYFLYSVFSASYKTDRNKGDVKDISVSKDWPQFPKVTDQYAELFSGYGSSALKSTLTHYYTFKQPIATFITIDDKYSVIVYKFNDVPNTLRFVNDYYSDT